MGLGRERSHSSRYSSWMMPVASGIRQTSRPPLSLKAHICARTGEPAAFSLKVLCSQRAGRMISSKPSAVKTPPQAVGGFGEGAGFLAREDSRSAQHGVLL